MVDEPDVDRLNLLQDADDLARHDLQSNHDSDAGKAADLHVLSGWGLHRTMYQAETDVKDAVGDDGVAADMHTNIEIDRLLAAFTHKHLNAPIC